ncbi:OTU domain-containing protein, partial [Saccharopolyspora elongata]|uniref:OTU domain-containing protein n=1 Tax=Saccharopolyspora elongata TaxID=2530387 RepID=UPI0038B5C6FD
ENQIIQWRPGKKDEGGPQTLEEYLKKLPLGNGQQLPLTRNGSGHLDPVTQQLVWQWTQGLHGQEIASEVARLSGGLVSPPTVSKWWKKEIEERKRHASSGSDQHTLEPPKKRVRTELLGSENDDNDTVMDDAGLMMPGAGDTANEGSGGFSGRNEDISRLTQLARLALASSEFEVPHAQRTTARALGLQIRDVAADGDCFYQSVVDSVPQEEWDRRGYARTVPGLRHALADYLLQDDSHLSYFAALANGDDMQATLQLQEAAANIRKSRTWNNDGGDIAPQLVADLLDVNIKVIGPDGVLSTQGTVDDGTRRTYYIVYNGTNHYMATQRLQDTHTVETAGEQRRDPIAPHPAQHTISPRTQYPDPTGASGHTTPHRHNTSEMTTASRYTENAGQPFIRHLDQARTELTWPANSRYSDDKDDELRIVRAIDTHTVTPAAGMDDMFPWRDSADPARRVFAPYADEHGNVHPLVRKNADQITARMYAAGRNLLAGIAADANDTRLPNSAMDRLKNRVWPQLEKAVAQEIRRLTLGDPNPSFPVRVRTVEHKHVRPHEHILVGQSGLFLSPSPADMFLDEQPSLLNGRILGVYLGAVIRDQHSLDNWRTRYSAFPAYAMNLDAEPSLEHHLMSAEGAANSIAFANTAVTEGPEPAIDLNRVNAQFVEFRVNMPTNTGQLRSQSIMVLIALDNAFDILTNPYGIIIADYGDGYVDLFKKTDNNVKEEPAD